MVACIIRQGPHRHQRSHATMRACWKVPLDGRTDVAEIYNKKCAAKNKKCQVPTIRLKAQFQLEEKSLENGARCRFLTTAVLKGLRSPVVSEKTKQQDKKKLLTLWYRSTRPCYRTADSQPRSPFLTTGLWPLTPDRHAAPELETQRNDRSEEGWLPLPLPLPLLLLLPVSRWIVDVLVVVRPTEAVVAAAAVAAVVRRRGTACPPTTRRPFP